MYALVTGATSGIGLEIAKILATMNYNLILVGRRIDRLQKLKAEVEDNNGIKAIAMQCDLSDTEQVYKLIKETDMYEDIDVVINSAGFGKMGYVIDASDESDLGMISTNITALHILTKHFVKKMKKGNIVNIASIAGTVPGPYMSVYGATKAYVLNFSLAFGYELKRLKKDIHITTACPGPVETEFNDVAGASYKLKSITAKKCAECIIKAMKKKKRVIMVSPTVKLLHFLSKISPYGMILPVEYNLQIKKVRD